MPHPAPLYRTERGSALHSGVAMTSLCDIQPKMRAKFKVSFKSGDSTPDTAQHSSGSVSDDSEGLSRIALLFGCSCIAALLLLH